MGLGQSGGNRLRADLNRLEPDRESGCRPYRVLCGRQTPLPWRLTETLETQMETRTLADTARTADAKEGICAFLQKRPPDFSGG